MINPLLKTIKKSFKPIKFTIGIFVIIFFSSIFEIISRVKPLIWVNNLQGKAEISFSALIVLALFSGTILSFAKFERSETKYGFTANERILFYNSVQILSLKVNLLEVLIVNLCLIPISLLGYIFEFSNFTISLFVTSIVLTTVEFLMSIKILSNKIKGIDDNCKGQLLIEISKSDFTHIKVMFISFLDKINDNFIFEDDGEYIFFIEKLLQHETDNSKFKMYYVEAERLISNLMADRRLNWGRFDKLTNDLIYSCKWTVRPKVIMYIHDAVFELAKNDSGEISSLYFCLFKCSEKLESDEIRGNLRFLYLAQYIWHLFVQLQSNMVMSAPVKNENVKCLEKKAVQLAILETAFINPKDSEEDMYETFDEQAISYHQYLMFQFIQHYVKTENMSLVNILNGLTLKTGIDENNKRNHINNLRYNLSIKVAYYIFSTYMMRDVDENKKCFIDKTINYQVKSDGRWSNLSFRETISFMKLKSNVFSLRKDTSYDYVFSNGMGESKDDFIRFLVCISALKGIQIDYTSLINIEIGRIFDMFTPQGNFTVENRKYYKAIAQFYKLTTSNKHQQKLYKDVLEAMDVHPYYFPKTPIPPDVQTRLDQTELEYLVEHYTF